MKGYVFFDYDGTLADERDGIFLPTPTTVDSIKRLSDNGYIPILATGRAKCYAPTGGVEFGGFLTSNGTCCEIGGEVIFDMKIEKELLDRLTEFMRRLDIPYSMENMDCCRTWGCASESFSHMLEVFKLPKNIFKEISDGEDFDANKLIISFDSWEKLNILSEHFKDEFIFTPHRSGMSADVDRIGRSKGDGIRRLMDITGVSRDKIYAFGDGGNDYDMLKIAGTGIAMTPHHELLDEVCDLVTDSVKNEGVTKGLIRLGLI